MIIDFCFINGTKEVPGLSLIRARTGNNWSSFSNGTAFGRSINKEKTDSKGKTNKLNNLKFIPSISLIFVILLFCSSCFFNIPDESDQVCFENHCVNIELAYSSDELSRGLQFRKSLDDHEGMLFAFPKDSMYRFWMKDTLIPLDIIWMDRNRKIIFIASNVPPCKEDPCPNYGPDEKARYVLEVNAGYVNSVGLKKGDQAIFFIKD